MEGKEEGGRKGKEEKEGRREGGRSERVKEGGKREGGRKGIREGGKERGRSRKWAEGGREEGQRREFFYRHKKSRFFGIQHHTRTWTDRGSKKNSNRGRYTEIYPGRGTDKNLRNLRFPRCTGRFLVKKKLGYEISRKKILLRIPKPWYTYRILFWGARARASQNFLKKIPFFVPVQNFFGYRVPGKSKNKKNLSSREIQKQKKSYLSTRHRLFRTRAYTCRIYFRP
jgi:hypothetical protein